MFPTSGNVGLAKGIIGCIVFLWLLQAHFAMTLLGTTIAAALVMYYTFL